MAGFSKNSRVCRNRLKITVNGWLSLKETSDEEMVCCLVSLNRRFINIVQRIRCSLLSSSSSIHQLKAKSRRERLHQSGPSGPKAPSRCIFLLSPCAQSLNRFSPALRYCVKTLCQANFRLSASF